MHDDRELLEQHGWRRRTAASVIPVPVVRLTLANPRLHPRRGATPVDESRANPIRCDADENWTRNLQIWAIPIQINADRIPESGGGSHLDLPCLVISVCHTIYRMRREAQGPTISERDSDQQTAVMTGQVRWKVVDRRIEVTGRAIDGFLVGWVSVTFVTVGVSDSQITTLKYERERLADAFTPLSTQTRQVTPRSIRSLFLSSPPLDLLQSLISAFGLGWSILGGEISGGIGIPSRCRTRTSSNTSSSAIQVLSSRFRLR